MERQKQELLNRLKRIEGQIRGLQRLVEQEATCEDILMQTRAALSAIRKVSAIVIQTHLENCLQKGSKGGRIKRKAALEELKEVITRYIDLA